MTDEIVKIEIPTDLLGKITLALEASITALSEGTSFEEISDKEHAYFAISASAGALHQLTLLEKELSNA